MQPQPPLRPHLRSLSLAAILSVAFWFIPFLRWVTVPLQYVNTHIHEAWHAVATVATGGAVDHIQVHANGNGETLTMGGMGFVISSAGYVGAALSGALILALATSGRAARAILIAIAVGLAYSLVVWVRSDWFGIVTCASWIAVLFALATYLPNDKRLFAIQFLGVQQCLNAIQSLFFLVQISGFGVKQSDAGNMEQATGIPAIVWAAVWSAMSLGLMFLGLKISLRNLPTANPQKPDYEVGF